MVSEEAQRTNGDGDGNPSDANSRNGGSAEALRDEILRNDVYSAATYGDMEKLRRLVESEGSSVYEPDQNGYYALQWAALNNRTMAAYYIIQHGGDVNAVDYTGQTALHWSAVRGATEVAELLLQEGAHVNAADLYGYQVTHVAAQYGQTFFLYRIISKWNAQPDVLDNDGRSPLHWAAYKGFADCIRLLLFLDAYGGRQDKEGCTPLHWAATRGNLEACMVLIQSGNKEDLMVKNNDGFTPARLASEKNQQQASLYLGNAKRTFDIRCDRNCYLGKSSKFGLAPVLWCIILVLLITYIHYVIIAAPNLPKLGVPLATFAWFGALLAIAGLVMSYRCCRKDPGYIKMNVHDSQSLKDDEPLLKIELDHPALLAGNWSQLCSTCKIVRPLRSKHCSVCDRCVEQFDHHCPWVSNCIGKKNKWEFFMFLILEISATLISGVSASIRILTDPVAPSSFLLRMNQAITRHIGALSFLIVDIFLFFSVAILTILQAFQISHNITTNEMANARRYTYLKGPEGQFRNPYDHGIWNNCSDFIIHGCYEDKDNDEAADSEGTGMAQL